MKDLSNIKYNRLLVLEFVGRRRWKCLCDCGNTSIVLDYHLKTGHTKSCGCYNIERATIHGLYKESEYHSFSSARARCQNQNDKDYYRYGGVGIEFRFESLNDIFEEIGKRPSSKYSIDRINTFGHYEKGNIRWATSKEQNRNRKNNTKILFNGLNLIPAEWAEITKFKETTIRRRFFDYKWCVECTLTLEVHKGHCLHKYDKE